MDGQYEGSTELASFPKRFKRLRHCLSDLCPAATLRVGSKTGQPLENTWVGELAKLQCPTCGCINVFNPVAPPKPHPTKTIYVAFDGRRTRYIVEPIE